MPSTYLSFPATGLGRRMRSNLNQPRPQPALPSVGRRSRTVGHVSTTARIISRSMAKAEEPVQRQIDAYNARDLERFLTEYTKTDSRCPTFTLGW